MSSRSLRFYIFYVDNNVHWSPLIPRMYVPRPPGMPETVDSTEYHAFSCTYTSLTKVDV